MSSVTSYPPSDGPENQGHTLLAIIWSEAAVGAAVICVRYYTRAFYRRQLGWDDFWMLITWITGLVTNLLDTIGIHYGIGQHLFYLTPYERMMAVQFDWISHAFAITATGIGKVSFACTLLRIVHKRGQKWFLHGYIWLLVAVNVPLIFMTYLQCQPVQALWNPAAAIDATCWNPQIQAGYAVFQGIYGVIADLVLAVFPIVFIRTLQASTKTKIGLCCLMGLGVFAAACAAMKTYYLPRMTARADFTWETQYLIIWFTSEMYAIMIAASIPAIRPLFGRGSGGEKSSQETPSSRDTFETRHQNQYNREQAMTDTRLTSNWNGMDGTSATSTVEHDPVSVDGGPSDQIEHSGIMKKMEVTVTTESEKDFKPLTD